MKNNVFVKGFVFCLFTIFVFSSCNFWESFSEEPSDDTTLSFGKTNLEMKTGSIEMLSLSVSDNQNGASITWEYDKNILKAVTDNYGAVLTAIGAGQTQIKAIYNGNGSYASCMVTVSGELYKPHITNPYVYASRDYVSLSPNQRIRISGALFGGTPTDSGGFSWSIDHPSVASLSTEGNSCWITGLSAGQAKITLRHSKSTYPYSVLVDVLDDGTMTPFITTGNNIVTIDLDATEPTATITADIMNLTDKRLENFRFSVVDENGYELINSPLTITGTTANICYLRASEEGECRVRITHPNAVYPLDVLVRIMKQSDSSYIEVTDTMPIVSGNTKTEIRAFIADTSESFEPSKFSWQFPVDASYYADINVLNGNGTDTGNIVEFIGKKTGSFRCTVSYPGYTERSVIVVLRDFEAEASKTTTYVSTDQNFISMTPGEETTVNIMLSDCSYGDYNDLMWSLISYTADGVDSDVVQWISGMGRHESKRSRSARTATNLVYNENASCVIKALRAGHAVIEISHPKALYSTKIDILVKEKATEPAKKSMLSYVTNPIIKLKNGTEENNTAFLNINFNGDGSESDIVWHKEENSLLTLNGNCTSCEITSPSDANAGKTTSTVWVTHPNFDGRLNFTVYTYSTEEEFNAIPNGYFYTYKNTSISLNIDEYAYLNVEACSGEVNESNIYVPVNIKWTSTSPSVAAIEEASNGYARIIAKSCGTAVITAMADGEYPCIAGNKSVQFSIIVKDGRFTSETEDVWLSTRDNVIYFDDENSASQNINVVLHNMKADELIQWSCSNPAAFSLSYSGNTATVTPRLPESTGIVTVSHPNAVNTLEINLRSGKLYEYKNPDVVLIEPSKKVLNLISGQKEIMVSALLTHTSKESSNEDEKGFIFSIDNSSLANCNYTSGSNICFIEPLKEGKCVLTIKNSKADYDCEIPVIITRPENFVNLPYITTETNIITLIEGDMEPVSVSLVNVSDADAAVISKWKWEMVSADKNYAGVVVQNGKSAMINGYIPGIQKVRITHNDCPYPLELTVNVLSRSSVEKKPFLKTDKNIVTLAKGESITVTAEMLGGNAALDNPLFSWTASDSFNILINPSENKCYIKALQSGTSKITVRNSRYSGSYERTILVIVEDSSTEGCYIKPSTNILKLSPKSNGLTKITAELINGSLVDYQDFIWWADDYSLVMLTSIAGECSITPKGQSGTTYVHIKHPKSSQTCDIYVSISEFTDFEFSTSSMKMRAGKLYFIPMHVPATDADYEIEYETPDQDICWTSGTKSTAYVAARHAGTLTISATMKTSDGNIISQAQLLVNIVEDDTIIPDISVGQSCIIEMTEGDDITLPAVISGGGISEAEKYNLEWEIDGGEPDGLMFSNTIPSRTFTGCDALVSAIKGDKEYVIKVRHPSTGAETSLCVKVAKKGQLALKLSTYYEMVYKEDGSFQITATVENGQKGDEKNISWSTVRSNGVNVVSVTKSNGPTCTVVPKTEGMTIVVARLPSGVQTHCTVVVQPEATIVFGTGNVHVMPGEWQEISYYTEPAQCTLRWVEEMNSTSSFGGTIERYFTYEVDETAKKIRVHGEKVVDNNIAGTIKALMTSTRCTTIPVLNVYVDYDTNMDILDSTGKHPLVYFDNNQNNPKSTQLDNFTFKVRYYPSIMKIEVTSGDESIVDKNINVSTKEVLNANGMKETEATVVLKPKKEGTANINIRTWLADVPTVCNVKTIKYNAYYTNPYQFDYTVNTSAGAFSKLVNPNDLKAGVILGDGEELLLYVDILNEQCGGKVEKLVWNPSGFEIEYSKQESNGKQGTYLLDKKRSKQKKKFNDNSGVDFTVGSRAVNGTLISLEPVDTVTQGGGHKEFWRLAHNFDYYKELPVISETTTDMSGRTVPYYLALNSDGSFKYLNDLDYWLIEKDMYWNIKCKEGNFHLPTFYWNNQGIKDWIIDGANSGYDPDFINTVFGGTSSHSENIHVHAKFSNGYHYSDNALQNYTIHRGCGSTSNVYEGEDVTSYSYSYSYCPSKNINDFDYSPLSWEQTGTNSSYTGLPYGITEILSDNPFMIWKTKTKTSSSRDSLHDKIWFEDYYEPMFDTSKKDTTGTHHYDVPIKDSNGEITGYEHKTEEVSVYYYDYDTNGNYFFYRMLSYPHNIKTGSFSDKGDYMYVSYENCTPYVIDSYKLIHNSNYYFPLVKGTAHYSESGKWYEFGNGGSSSSSELCMLPALMHEYCVPCISPDQTIKEKKLIGNITVVLKKAQQGQGNSQQTTDVNIPVYIEKRNCQAYQSLTWKDMTVNGIKYWVKN